MSKFLKERRKELGKELNEIAAVTRIKGAYLKSIEEEEFDKLPVEVYTKGYIREYSEFLGIPSEIALEPYENYLHDKRAGKEKQAFDENAAAVLSREVIDNLDVSKEGADLRHMDLLLSPEVTSRGPDKPLALKMLWVFPALAAAAAIYFFTTSATIAPPVLPAGEQASSNPQIPSPPPVINHESPQDLSSAAENNAAVKVVSAPKADELPEMPQLQKNAKDKTAASEEGDRSAAEKKTAVKWRHTINIDATDKVWIRVLIDGTEKRDAMLNQGDKVTYGANKSFAVLIGNASGANILFDGRHFEKLGAKGEVVKLNFPVSDDQIPVEPLPPPDKPEPHVP